MLTAELVKPARLNVGGRLWIKGEPQPVSLAHARRLHGNKRFKVNGLFEVMDAMAKGESVDHLLAPEEVLSQGSNAPAGRPTDKADLYAAIRAASDSLDIDDETSFDDNGLPSLVALNKALGYEVTEEERQGALSIGSRGKLEAESGSTGRALRIPKNRPDPSTAGAVGV